MPASKYPDMTATELTQLYEQYGTWRAVATHLGISRSCLYSLKTRHKVKTVTDRSQWRKKPSVLDDHFHDIQPLAQQCFTCREIKEALDLPVQTEQIRRWLHKNGIELHAKQGAQPGSRHRDWKGGRNITKDGYVLVYRPDHPNARNNGYILEHRLVMAEEIGRPLTDEEVVHHINGIRDDNRLENLQLFESNAEHLAETLAGQIPNWSEEGKKRMAEGVQKMLKNRYK